jgi:hypothetical protein
MMKLFAGDVRAFAGYFKGILLEGRQFLREEAVEIALLFGLLRRRLRVHGRWTRQEIREMKIHFRKALKMVYPVAIILLPGGLLFLPLIAGALHKKH